MWDELVRRVHGYPSAVLTGRDAGGHPFSVRCHPRADPDARVLRVELPPGTPLRPGPAGLLCHRHDEQLWNLSSFLVRGELRPDPPGWAFHPRQLVPGMAPGLLANLRLLVRGRRTTRRYLAARGLPRPAIPWDDFEWLRREATRR